MNEKPFLLHKNRFQETYATCAVTIYVRVSITVQTIDLPEPEENDERIVVVKGEVISLFLDQMSYRAKVLRKKQKETFL